MTGFPVAGPYKCSFCSRPLRVMVRVVPWLANGRIDARTIEAISSFIGLRSPLWGAEENAPVPAGHEGRDVGQHTGQRQAAGVGEVARTPHGMELLLVGSQSLEVV